MSANGGTEYRVPLQPRGGRADRPPARQHHDRAAAADAGARLGRHHRHVRGRHRSARTSKSSCASPRRMASLGLLAAGVAHEVNTPLTGISSYTQMLLEQADPADPRTQVLEKIEKQTFRAARIVNGLLNLSRPAEADDSERTRGRPQRRRQRRAVAARASVRQGPRAGAPRAVGRRRCWSSASSSSCSRCSSTCS